MGDRNQNLAATDQPTTVRGNAAIAGDNNNFKRGTINSIIAGGFVSAFYPLFLFVRKGAQGLKSGSYLFFFFRIFHRVKRRKESRPESLVVPKTRFQPVLLIGAIFTHWNSSCVLDSVHLTRVSICFSSGIFSSWGSTVGGLNNAIVGGQVGFRFHTHLPFARKFLIFFSNFVFFFSESVLGEHNHRSEQVCRHWWL
jgi:hypothetical protein